MLERYMNTLNLKAMKYVHIDNHKLSLTVYGTEFLILQSSEGLNLIPLAESIYQANLLFAEEVIGTEKEICIKLANDFDIKAKELLTSIKTEKKQSQKIYTLPVFFNEHKDWANLEAYSKKSRGEIINEMVSRTFQFHMYGFLPGFLYIKGLPEYLHCPRKSVPEKRVEAGTLAIGGPYLGYYSNPSPGGWHSVGSCALKVFDKTSLPPVKIQQGDALKLVSIPEKEHQILLTKNLQLTEYG